MNQNVFLETNNQSTFHKSLIIFFVSLIIVAGLYDLSVFRFYHRHFLTFPDINMVLGHNPERHNLETHHHKKHLTLLQEFHSL